MKTFFQKKKIKVKEALSTHAGARCLFVQGMLLKRRARTGNGERGTGNRERGTWNVERENDKPCKNKTENWKGSY